MVRSATTVDDARSRERRRPRRRSSRQIDAAGRFPACRQRDRERQRRRPRRSSSSGPTSAGGEVGERQPRAFAELAERVCAPTPTPSPLLLEREQVAELGDRRRPSARAARRRSSPSRVSPRAGSLADASAVAVNPVDQVRQGDEEQGEDGGGDQQPRRPDGEEALPAIVAPARAAGSRAPKQGAEPEQRQRSTIQNQSGRFAAHVARPRTWHPPRDRERAGRRRAR